MDAPTNPPEPDQPQPIIYGLATQYVSKASFNDCWAELQSVKLAAREAEEKAARAMQAAADLEDHNAYLLSRLQETGHQLTEATQLVYKRTSQLTDLARSAQSFAVLVDAKAQVYSKEDRELLNAFYVHLKGLYTYHLKHQHKPKEPDNYGGKFGVRDNY